MAVAKPRRADTDSEVSFPDVRVPASSMPLGAGRGFEMAHADAMARVLRLADGPDQVHRQQLGRMELKKYR